MSTYELLLFCLSGPFCYMDLVVTKFNNIYVSEICKLRFKESIILVHNKSDFCRDLYKWTYIEQKISQPMLCWRRK
jgi:hypothetical protein